MVTPLMRGRTTNLSISFQDSRVGMQSYIFVLKNQLIPVLGTSVGLRGSLCEQIRERGGDSFKSDLCSQMCFERQGKERKGVRVWEIQMFR